MGKEHRDIFPVKIMGREVLNRLGKRPRSHLVGKKRGRGSCKRSGIVSDEQEQVEAGDIHANRSRYGEEKSGKEITKRKGGEGQILASAPEGARCSGCTKFQRHLA